MSESKLAQAIDRLSLQLRDVGKQMEALTSEIKRLHYAIDKLTGEKNHPPKSTQTPVSRRAAFETYLGGKPDAS